MYFASCLSSTITVQQCQIVCSDTSLLNRYRKRDTGIRVLREKEHGDQDRAIQGDEGTLTLHSSNIRALDVVVELLDSLLQVVKRDELIL